MSDVADKTEDGWLLRVRISPNSSSCLINGVYLNAEGVAFLKVSVNAVPEKGKANKELVAFLAKKLKIAKTRILIVRGETDRCKFLEIADPHHEIGVDLLDA